MHTKNIENNKFYLRDSRSCVGSSCLFWGLGGRGYTTALEKAEVYSLEEARAAYQNRSSDIPLNKELVDALSVLRVDMQLLEEEQGTISPSDQYYVLASDRYDGNDIEFCTMFGRSFNLVEAEVYSLAQIQKGNVTERFFTKEFIDSIARSTLNCSKVNIRKMTQNSGVKYKTPRKRKQTTGKTRFNCTFCGKIHWQYDPYSFEGCSDRFCDGYNTYRGG